MAYIKRVLNIALFFVIWLGVPWFIVHQSGNNGWWLLIFFTWLVAIFSTEYLDSDDYELPRK